MISVAMCTYNGESYLTAQLESIAQQSCPVDELVICDDRSSDRTVAILKDFAEKAPFSMKIVVNEVNLGSTKNFEKALSLCKGDVLFLSDQDDVWRHDKVERILAYFEENPSHDAVFTNADLIDGNGSLKPGTLWESFGFDAQKQALWKAGGANEILFRGYIVTGATMAIKRAVVKELSPFPLHLRHYIHDAWIALALGVRNRIGFIDDTLISYRIHESQQVGFGKQEAYVTLRDRMKRDRALKLTPLKNRAELLGNLFALLERLDGVRPETLSTLKCMQGHFEKRAQLPDNRLFRLGPVVLEGIKGNYRFSSEHWWLPLLGDLFE
jgi:glycosyltransferase involved in cell wall biosynthesis